MPIRVKKKNVARLASLSALGAGALGVAAGTAEAGTIVYQPLGTTVGIDYKPKTTIAFPGGAHIAVSGQYFAATIFNPRRWFLEATGAPAAEFVFAGTVGSLGMLYGFGPGRNASTVKAASATQGLLAERLKWPATTLWWGAPPYGFPLPAQEYLMFAFVDSGK
jgi:hypothetical protein